MWTTLFISCTVFTVLSGHLESSEQKMQLSSSKFSRRRPKDVNVLHVCCWFVYWRPDPKRHEMARFDTSIILRPVPHTPGTSIILRPVPPMWFRVTRMDTNWHELARIGTHWHALKNCYAWCKHQTHQRTRVDTHWHALTRWYHHQYHHLVL